MESALAVATAEARARGVSGKALTPFLLDRIRASTGGLSLAANTALIVANAGLAGAVAAALAGGQHVGSRSDQRVRSVDRLTSPS